MKDTLTCRGYRFPPAIIWRVADLDFGEARITLDPKETFLVPVPGDALPHTGKEGTGLWPEVTLSVGFLAVFGPNRSTRAAHTR